MNKSMYSLILSDDVIERIDMRAKLMNLSRSGLIDRILAEYVSVVTPEQRVKSIYELMAQQMNAFQNEFRFLLGSGDNAFTAVSALKYKYNPTIRYNVLLYRGGEHFGELRCTLRTQNAQLLHEFEQFLKIWNRIETAVWGKNILCEYKGGIFRRIIEKPQSEVSPQEMSSSITEYISLFNSSVKLFLSNKESLDDTCEAITKAYVKCVKDGKIKL